MNINRDYLIINDVKKSNIKLDNGSMFFYITDKNTQNIFVNLVINISNNDLIQKYANIENAEDYTLTMNIVKPDNTYKIIEGKLHDKEKAIFEFNLNEDCCDEIGTYRCELLTKCNINDHEEITTSNKLTYKVKSSVLNDLDDIVEAPEYPLVIQLFDKLSDIEQYEEDRRANEVARQLAEEQRQQRFNELDADMVDRVTAMDDKMVDVENRVSAKEQAVDKLIVDTKKDIDDYKVAKDTEIDEYKATKDQQIDQAITNQNNKIDDAIANQNNKIDTAVAEQNNRIEIVEASDNTQNTRLDALEAKDIAHETSITNIEAKNVEQDNRLDSIEAVNISQDNRLDAIEMKNQQQDDRLLDAEKVNKRQDMDLKCLFAESKNNMIDVTEEGNSVYLQNSTVGYTLIDEIQGNTMVNCNKEPDKEIILNGNINTQGYGNVTLTEGVNGGLVDVALEGNTMVNVCDQKDAVAITKSYTVETGNHVALQGEYDGKCRPVVTGNTLVNLAIMRGVYSRVDGSNGANSLVDLAYGLKPSTVYTRIVNVSKVILGTNSGIAMYDAINSSDGTYKQYNWFNDDGSRIYITTPGIYISKFTTSELGTQNIYQITPGSQAFNGSTGAELEISNLILLEGDYTNKPIPEYFEGLQSSFEDNLVTQEMVDAREEEAENLGKYKVDYVVTGNNNKINSEFIPINSSNQANSMTINGNEYIFECSNPYNQIIIHFKDLSNKTLSYSSVESYVGDELMTEGTEVSIFNNANYIRVICDIRDSWKPITKVKFINLKLEEGTVATPYEPDKEYTKTFYLNSPLLEGDTIEQQGNNVVHVHRYGKAVLDGSSDEGLFVENSITNNNTLAFKYENPQIKNAVICDKFPYEFSFSDTEHVVSNPGWVCFLINKTKLSIQNITGVKSYLQQNPITVVYQLATPQCEVISQNDTILCDSYTNGHLDVDSVVPIDKVAFERTPSPYLRYLYPSTEYIVQFEADNNGYLKELYMNGIRILNAQVTKGINKFTGTTGTNNWTTLDMDGIGFNASNIVVTEATDQDFGYFEGMKSVGECEDLAITSSNSDNTLSNTQTLTHEPLRAIGEVKDRYILIDGKWYIERNCGVRTYQEGDIDNYITDMINTVYPLETPTYEPIEYNSFEVYSSTTHISNNSTIPCNMTIKNTGYNCLLKPSTTYTVSSNLGLNTVTTPSTLTEDCLRFMDTDTSDVTTMKDVMVLEGDWTTKADLIPSNFSGIESAFEQELVTDENDVNYGKYKVNVKVVGKNLFNKGDNWIKGQYLDGYDIIKYNDDAYYNPKYLKVNPNETYYSIHKDGTPMNISYLNFYDKNKNFIKLTNDATQFTTPSNAYYIRVSIWINNIGDNGVIGENFIGNSTVYEPYKESNITFYINEPLRGVGNIKDKVFIKDDKVVVQRNCGQREYQDGDFGTYLTDKVNTVYPLAELTYEEVEYNDTKLFIESFKNSTLSYNSNVPVTSKLYYSYSVPIVDTVAQTASISDEQDNMIIDLATQVAVMEMMLM